VRIQTPTARDPSGVLKIIHAYKAYNGDHGMSGAGMVYRHVLTCDRKGLYGSSQRRLPRWIISGPESLR
jgi:hypothetical protein